MSEHAVLKRSTVNPQVFGGKSMSPGSCLVVEHVPGMFAADDYVETLLEGCPWLEKLGIQACLAYAG
jgi:uncharacterized protein (DUF433 family)